MSTILPHRMSQSLIPPPLKASSNHQDPLIYVERQAKYIQRNLQLLIDAQSEGLLAGLNRQQPEGSVSNDSHASSSGRMSVQGVWTVPIRQPPRKKIGLRSAREGIFTSMYDLMTLREEEQEILSLKLEERGSGLNEISKFITKRSGLERAISDIKNDRETQQTKDLREESSRLEVEIHDMENKLSRMKAKQRNIVQQLSQIENSVESKLSSYKASLSLLESDVRRFLSNPPIKPQRTNAAKDNFYSLNASRRTLEMAEEHWTTEQIDLQRRQDEVHTEIEALDEGCAVWKKVVEDISGFEKRLRTVMRQSIRSQSQLLQNDAKNGEDDLVHVILEDLEKTTDHVEQHLDHAEERNWKLLVCCISAELQALREARGMLLEVFNISEKDIRSAPNGTSADSPHAVNNDSQLDPLGVDNPEPPADLLQSHHQQSAKGDDEDEDEDPDPAWLLPET
ncbi:hypothetical protein BJY04DRAFT_179981 [Aspergillus karnatakaensis]|uniref:uncharacterized protein n=1 Tax=Aspergillus karnatakaensis TaxID=1810916 RepID=UPI003CCD2A62